jgi:hypothetical protein
MVVAAHRSSLTALSLLRRKFEDLGNRCPEPLYAFVTAVDTPSPVATEFDAHPSYMFSILREPHAPATSLYPGLGVVRTGASVILSRDGIDRLRTKDDSSRTYTVGVLRRQDERRTRAIRDQLLLARVERKEEAVQQLERDLSFAPRCPDLDSWLREYEVLAGRAWACLPPEIRGLRSEYYAYPGMLCSAAWSWTQLQFVLAWSGGEGHGLTAPRCVVNRGGFCDAEAFLRKVKADSKDAGRGSPKADRAVLAARDELRRSHGLWPSFDSDLQHPLTSCRAVMEPTLCDASVLAIHVLTTTRGKGGRRRRSTPRRPDAVPGWTQALLRQKAGIGRTLFTKICDAVGVSRPGSGGHGYEFTLKDLQSMVARCGTISGKRDWQRAGEVWQTLIDSHLATQSGA